MDSILFNLQLQSGLAGIEMSPRWQSRNVPFCPGPCGVRVNLLVPVKRRRAMVATNPIEE